MKRERDCKRDISVQVFHFSLFVSVSLQMWSTFNACVPLGKFTLKTMLLLMSYSAVPETKV